MTAAPVPIPDRVDVLVVGGGMAGLAAAAFAAENGARAGRADRYRPRGCYDPRHRRLPGRPGPGEHVHRAELGPHAGALEQGQRRRRLAARLHCRRGHEPSDEQLLRPPGAEPAVELHRRAVHAAGPVPFQPLHPGEPSPAPLPAAPEPLVEPPIYALEVQPAITFTYGGLRTDTNGRVLDHDVRVDGLWAAGVDAGGLSNWTYAGGLAPAFITGRRAAASALATLANGTGGAAGFGTAARERR